MTLPPPFPRNGGGRPTWTPPRHWWTWICRAPANRHLGACPAFV